MGDGQSNGYATFPSAVYQNFLTVQIYADSAVPLAANTAIGANAWLTASNNIGQAAILWSLTRAAQGLGAYFQCCGLYSAWPSINGYLTASEDPAAGAHLYTYQPSTRANGDLMWIDGNPVTTYYPFDQGSGGSGDLVGSRYGSLIMGGNGKAGGQMLGHIYRVLFYSRTITASEVAQNDVAIEYHENRHGVFKGQYTPPVGNTIACLGDSILYGYPNLTAHCSSAALTG